MSNEQLLTQHLQGSSVIEIRAPKAITAVADLTASKLVLTDASKNIVSSTLAEGDIVTGASTDTFTNKTFDANGTGNSISNLEVADFASGVIDTNISTVSGSDDTIPSAKAVKTYVDAQIADVTPTVNWQTDVLDIQVDNTLDPGATPTTGDRYIITDAGALHANFGTITGVANNDIVEFDGADFVVSADVSVIGEGILTWNDANNALYQYNGTAWVNRNTLFTYTASSGITLSGNNFQIDANAITNTMLAGSIADSKLSTITTANKVSGSAVQLASNGGLENSTGLKILPDATTGATVVPITLGANGAGITVDNATLENNSGTGRVKSGGIGATQLASNAVTTVKITDANVTFAKFAADAKPAVGTFNGTTDWTSSIVTITAATHGLGTNVTATLDKVVTGAVVASFLPQIASNGDVSFEVVAGLEFAGRYTVEKRA